MIPSKREVLRKGREREGGGGLKLFRARSAGGIFCNVIIFMRFCDSQVPRSSLRSLIMGLEKFVAYPWLALSFPYFFLLLLDAVIILLCFMAVIFYAGLSSFLRDEKKGGDWGKNKAKKYRSGMCARFDEVLLAKRWANFLRS